MRDTFGHTGRLASKTKKSKPRSNTESRSAAMSAKTVRAKNEDPAIDWSEQQSVGDAFVDAVHRDDEVLVLEAGGALVDACFEGTFEWPEPVNDGPLLKYAQVPDDPYMHAEGVEILDGLVSDERLEQLLAGEDLTPREQRLWTDKAAETILAGDQDWDVYWLWSVKRITHSDRRRKAFIVDVGGGYSFTKPWSSFVGGTRTLKEAYALLHELGYHSIADYRARSPKRRRRGRDAA